MPQIDGITVARLARTADPMPQVSLKPLDNPAPVRSLRDAQRSA
jgi:hypothetical protein